MRQMTAAQLEEFEQMELYVYSMIEKKQLIEIPEPTEPQACIVLYFDDNDKLCHSGKIELDSWPKVKSVWINRYCYMPGNIVEHDVWHVPSSFGTKVKYYFPAPNLSAAWSK